MGEEDDDDSADQAHWLKDAGRRRATRPRESAEELLKYLEELTGKKFTSRENILGYRKELWAEEAKRHHAETHRRIIRETIFLGVLLIAALQYHYWNVNLQIAALPHLVVFVPVADGDIHPARPYSPTESSPLRKL